MNLRKFVGKHWLENRGDLLRDVFGSKSPAASTVKIELFMDDGHRIVGTGVILDSNSILTAAHVLMPIVDEMVSSIRISTNKNAITELKPESVVADIIGNADPDRDGLAEYSLIGKDLGVLGSRDFSFHENSFASLHSGPSYSAVTQPDYGNSLLNDTVGINHGLVFAESNEIYRTTHEISKGDSGSGLFELTKDGYKVIGVVSTKTYSAKLTDDSIEQITKFAQANDVIETALTDQAQSAIDLIEKDDTKSSGLNNLVLISPLDKNINGGNGFDKALIKDSTSQIALDSNTGDVKIYWQAGSSSTLKNFEVIITPNSTIYTTNDKMYGLVHKGIQVLMGPSAADKYASKARAWFEDETDDLNIVNRLLIESGYSGRCKDSSKQLATSITENLQLSSKMTTAELSNVEEWADLHSQAELVLAGIKFIEQTNEMLG